MFQRLEENIMLLIHMGSRTCGCILRQASLAILVVRNKHNSSDRAASISVGAVIYLLIVMCKEPQTNMQIELQGRHCFPLAFSSS